MAITFGDNQYGKAEIRLVRIVRDADRHEITDLNVSSALRGDFAAAHLTGDNAKVVCHRHAEEHRLRLRPAVRGGRSRGVRAAARPALRGRLRAGRPARGSRSRSTPGTGSRSTAPHDHAFSARRRRDQDHGRHASTAPTAGWSPG